MTDQPADVQRAEVLRRCLIATHCLLSVQDGVFLSLLDPPAWASAAAKECTNLHTFPVLAGENGGRDVVLSSPIIMYDHPGVAPESPGDLHDACEIDEILTLRTLTLTDEEKREARATDPRAEAIVDRADVMPKEVFAGCTAPYRSAPGLATALDAMAEPAALPVPRPVVTRRAHRRRPARRGRRGRVASRGAAWCVAPEKPAPSPHVPSGPDRARGGRPSRCRRHRHVPWCWTTSPCADRTSGTGGPLLRPR